MNAFKNALQKSKKSRNKPKSKKKAMPELTPDSKEFGEVLQAVSKVRKAIKAKKDAEANYEHFGSIVIDYVRKHQTAEGFKNCYRKSYLVNGDNDSQVTFVSTNKFSVNHDDIELIRELVGDEFDTLFEETATVTLRPEVFKNDELAEELMELLGDDETFAKFFETTEKLKVKIDFDRNIFGLRKKVYETLTKVYVKQNKPGLK